MTFRKAIDRVRNWQGFLAGWRLAQIGLIAWLGVVIALIAAWRLLGTSSPCWSCALLGLLAITIVMALWGYRQRPDHTYAAWLLDDALGSKNLFGTLLSLDGNNGPVQQRLAAEAGGLAAKLHPPAAFPVRLSRLGRWSWLPALLLVGALFLPQKDPFGWRDSRERQVARNQLVESATAAIDQQLASPTIDEATREQLESAKEELAAAAGEHEATAALAKLQQQAAEDNSQEKLAAANEVLRQTAAAVGPDSTVAALAEAAKAQAQADKTDAQAGNNDPSPKQAANNAAEASNSANAAKGEPSSQSGKSAAGKPGSGDAGEQVAGGDGQPAAGKSASGDKPADTAGGSAAGGGTGSGGVGQGGGSSATANSGEVAFSELHVRGAEVTGKTIEELMRYDDDPTDDGAPRRLQQATAAAAANASAGLARSRVPSAAATAVRGYFESIAADARDK